MLNAPSSMGACHGLVITNYMSSEELEVDLREINPKVTHDEIEAMLKLADTNRDRQISYEEFREILHLLD